MSKNIIVELVDKNSGFADPVGRVNFSAAKVVQEVPRTEPIKKAIRQGILMETNKKRLEEWGQERKAYVEKHKSAKVASNAALVKSSVTLREEHAALASTLATEQATVKTLKKVISEVTDENVKLKKELEALKSDKEVTKATKK